MEKKYVDLMIRWEENGLHDWEMIELFSYLVSTGDVWTLQGFYGSQARGLINAGYIDNKGNILVDLEDYKFLTLEDLKELDLDAMYEDYTSGEHCLEFEELDINWQFMYHPMHKKALEILNYKGLDEEVSFVLTPWDEMMADYPLIWEDERPADIIIINACQDIVQIAWEEVSVWSYFIEVITGIQGFRKRAFELYKKEGDM